MTKLKYVIIPDTEGDINMEYVIIFPMTFVHARFACLKPISAGIFEVNKTGSINIVEGSSSLELYPRYGIDEVVIFSAISRDMQYLVVNDDDIKQESVIMFDGSIHKTPHIFNRMFKAVSSGVLHFLENKTDSSVCDRKCIDAQILSSVVNYGVVLL